MSCYMMGNLRITLTITTLRVFFKSSLIAKITRSFKLILPSLFLVHQVQRTAIIRKQRYSHCWLYLYGSQGNIVILYLNSWGMNRSEYWRQLLHRWPRPLMIYPWFSRQHAATSSPHLPKSLCSAITVCKCNTFPPLSQLKARKIGCAPPILPPPPLLVYIAAA